MGSQSSTSHAKTPVTRAWEEALRGFAELYQSKPTRYNKTNHTESRLDRILTATPSWLLKMLEVDIHLHESPLATFRKGRSDHAMLISSMQLRCPKALNRRPIPRWVTKTKVYADLIRKAAQEINISKYSPNEQ
eukprot:10739252-Karenia_brevis.AAC.1